MKKILLSLSIVAVFAALATLMYFTKFDGDSTVEQLRKQHEEFLANSPFKETQKLSRTERKAMGLPPNAYYEQMWELKMDPATGRPMPERVMELQQELRAERALAKGTGGENANPWVSRGPNNQGGRTRGLMFDPNDVGNADPNEDFNRVFAGGVSGGLWVNEDITDETVSWTLVPGIQANISVTVIVADPNDSDVFYIGSGESYTSGDAVGRGIWKSADGGVTWELIFGNGITSITNGGQLINGIFYINDIVIRDNNGISEIYAAVGSTFYGSASNPNNFNGLLDMGLYKSIDNGENWSRFNIKHENGNFKNPNDIELDLNNNIWLTTTYTFGYDDPGGDIYKSTDGSNFTLEYTIPNAARTEMEVSSLDVNKFWIAANVSGKADLFFTTDGFETLPSMIEPNDRDNDIPPNDYCRNQAFYNLPIEVDENDNLYVGGIDLFVTKNNGFTWSQLSKWSNNNSLGSLDVSEVHADQHAIVFRPGINNANAIIGNDGGVYFTIDLANAMNSVDAIVSRNLDYVTTQFYYGSISPVGEVDGDDLAGGTQDNGTQFINNAASGSNSFFDKSGGDGAFTEIDDSGSYVIQSFTFNDHRYRSFPGFTETTIISTNDEIGSFINQAELDKNLDILYTNASISDGAKRIERISEFLPGGAATEKTFLTSSNLDASPSAFKVSPFTTATTTLYVGLRNGKLLRALSANVGTPTFSNFGSPNFVGSISDIEFGQSEQEVFVTIHNYGVKNIWFTGNGGFSWRSIEGNLPDMPVKCILQNPLIPQELIIGTELGIWATPDYTVQNPVWVQAYNGMSDVTVLDLDLRAVDNTILASTYGRGMFTSQFTDTALSILENDFKTDAIVLFPTISNGNITFKSESQFGDAAVTVYNVSGKQVYTTNLNLSNTGTTMNLDVDAGIYFANIRVNNYSETKKFIIK